MVEEKPLRHANPRMNHGAEKVHTYVCKANYDLYIPVVALRRCAPTLERTRISKKKKRPREPQCRNERHHGQVDKEHPMVEHYSLYPLRNKARSRDAAAPCMFMEGASAQES